MDFKEFQAFATLLEPPPMKYWIIRGTNLRNKTVITAFHPAFFPSGSLKLPFSHKKNQKASRDFLGFRNRC